MLLDAQWAGYGQAGNDRTVVLDYQGPAIPVRHAYKPDAFFLTREREAILEHPGAPSVVGALDIVVEVLSPSTARHDRPPRGKKFKAYAQYGVAHYWLVDTKRRHGRSGTRIRRGRRRCLSRIRPGALEQGGYTVRDAANVAALVQTVANSMPRNSPSRSNPR